MLCSRLLSWIRGDAYGLWEPFAVDVGFDVVGDADAGYAVSRDPDAGDAASRDPDYGLNAVTSDPREAGW